MQLPPAKLSFAADEDHRNLQIVKIPELTMESPTPTDTSIIQFLPLGLRGHHGRGEERFLELEGQDACGEAGSTHDRNLHP